MGTTDSSLNEACGNNVQGLVVMRKILTLTAFLIILQRTFGCPQPIMTWNIPMHNPSSPLMASAGLAGRIDRSQASAKSRSFRPQSIHPPSARFGASELVRYASRGHLGSTCITILTRYSASDWGANDLPIY